MIILVGESASGKSSIEKRLLKYGLEKIVTYTTRPCRDGEKDGCDYNFINEETFCDMKEKDLFAETAEYNGWKYGTAKKDLDGNKVAVVTPSGFRKIKKILKDNISFYIKVPRRDRLIKILERGDNIEEAYRRNISDVGQFDGIENEVDFVIENAGYNKTVEEISSYIFDKYIEKYFDFDEYVDVEHAECFDNNQKLNDNTNENQRPFVMVYHDFLESDLLNYYEKMVFVTLKKFADNDTMRAFPSLKTIHKTTGISVSQVRRSISHMEELGVISIEHRTDKDKGHQSNIYTLYDYAEIWNTERKDVTDEDITDDEDIPDFENQTVAGYFHGTPCIAKPKFVIPSKPFEVEEAIKTAISNYVSKKLTLGEELNFHILPRFEDVDIYDFNEYCEQKIGNKYSDFVMINGRSYDRSEAFEVFSSMYKILILEIIP